MLVLAAMAKSHAFSRTIAQWVVWAQAEDMDDIVELDGDGTAKTSIIAYNRSDVYCTTFQGMCFANYVAFGWRLQVTT